MPDLELFRQSPRGFRYDFKGACHGIDAHDIPLEFIDRHAGDEALGKIDVALDV